MSTDAPASRQAGAPGGSAPGFDLDRPWRLDDRVAVRPELFGALLYHYGTRRLSFLKNTAVLESVYWSIVAGSEQGATLKDNVAAFGELGFTPHASRSIPG